MIDKLQKNQKVHLLTFYSDFERRSQIVSEYLGYVLNSLKKETIYDISKEYMMVAKGVPFDTHLHTSSFCRH